MQEGINQQQRSVNEPPNTKTAKRKAFGDTGLPLSQVKSVDSEYPQKHGQNHCDQSVLLGGWIQVCSVHGFFLENKIPICRTWVGNGLLEYRLAVLRTLLLLQLSFRNLIPLRSEEHTSELQSRPHLVCRLLLEKKKKSN